ncbi:EamA family transporter RarD [Moraxella sp. ZY200743]|uniref:EamA family transporter RarD n=1 Tax=Moraxella sp. ZY200743 TaxID=2911970 RepID=UPI003D7C6807
MNNATKPTIATTPKGLMTAILAFLIWGNFPFYFKLLDGYHAVEVIVHRVVWTFVVLSFVIIIGKRVAWLTQIRQNPKWLGLTFVSALLIGTNWLTYVWAVANDRVLEASLGYFINPLMGVGLSLIFFKERLRPLQKIAVVLAVLAVGIQVVLFGGVPWVSLILALSFAFYGVLQRQTPFNAIDGLFIETALLLPLCLIWLGGANVVSAKLAFWLSGEVWLLSLAGPITLMPLLLYNQSAKLVSFNTLSFLGYLTPSIVFMIAVFYYHEPMNLEHLAVFGLIWLGLLVYSMDMLSHRNS